MTDDLPKQRVRLLHAKGEAIKFISHQDEFRLWERTLRRAGLPLLYKQGFNPQPHMHFAAPLGVGFTGERELLDVVFSPPVPLKELAARIRAALPPGVTLHDAWEAPLKAEAPAQHLIGADYTIVLYAEPGELPAAEVQRRIGDLLAQEAIWRERQRKGEWYSYNLRPLIFELADAGYDATAEEQRIFLRVQQRTGATGRPDEVVQALGLDDFPRTLRRERLYFADDTADAALFAQYPVIEQAAIRGPQPDRKPGRPATHTASPRPAGRTIAERAADEFS
jgi:radical SAM-linked protein